MELPGFIGVLTIGGLVASYSYMARLFEPLNAAVEIYSRLKRLNASLERIVEIIEMAQVWKRAMGGSPPAPVRGQVKIEDVSFSYRDGQPVLQKFTLKLEPGEKVALVGISGSGQEHRRKGYR